MSKTLSKEHIRQIVQRHRPRGWRVQESKWRYAKMSGMADPNTCVLYVPTLLDEEAIFVFLHECGHVKRDHFNLELPKHLEEFEAEQYALHCCRTDGVKVTAAMRNRARARVRDYIERDEKHGVAIKPHVRRWAYRPTTGVQYE